MSLHALSRSSITCFIQSFVNRNVMVYGYMSFKCEYHVWQCMCCLCIVCICLFFNFLYALTVPCDFFSYPFYHYWTTQCQWAHRFQLVNFPRGEFRSVWLFHSTYTKRLVLTSGFYFVSNWTNFKKKFAPLCFRNNFSLVIFNLLKNIFFA